MGTSFTEALVGALDRFFTTFANFLPNLLAAAVIVILGVIAGWLLDFVVRRMLAVTRFDHFCADAGVTQVLSRADIRSSPSALAGKFTFWVIFLSFVMAGLSALGVDVISQLIAEFFLYLPRLFSALLILIFGFLIANFLSRATLLAAVNANLPSPRMFSIVVRVLIAILAFAMALEQLTIATSIVLAAFIIAFGAVMLGLAIAFGVGGADVARRVLQRHLLDRDREREKKPDEFSHL
jgi:hypothetical protein